MFNGQFEGKTCLVFACPDPVALRDGSLKLVLASLKSRNLNIRHHVVLTRLSDSRFFKVRTTRHHRTHLLLLLCLNVVQNSRLLSVDQAVVAQIVQIEEHVHVFKLEAGDDSQCVV